MTTTQVGVRQHGTRARYVAGPDENGQPGPCRCDDCRAANTQAMAEWRQRKVRRQWGAEPEPFVDAEPVRAHIQALSAAGVGWKRTAKIAGVHYSVVGNLLYGRPAMGRPPAQRISKANADKLLKVRAIDALADGALIDGSGTRRRLQALVTVGWTGAELMRRLGKDPTNFPYLVDRKQVLAGTARQVKTLYSELWDQQPPQDTAQRRAAADRARRQAAERGWHPPAAWDDDLIDLPDDELIAELDRLVSLMDDAELAACHTARYRHGDRTPLTHAAAREYVRRQKARRQAVAS